MRIALIADIHGNRIALEAVLNDIRREAVDKTVCLGDVAALGPEPAQTVDLLKSIDCPVVKGNADEAIFTEPEAPPGDPEWVRIGHLMKWAAASLDDAQAVFLRDAKPTVRIGDLLCCHGSPASFNDRIEATTPAKTLAKWMEGVEAKGVACGHTHLALLRRYGDMTILNPGSVGIPLVIDPHTGDQKITRFAEYAIVTARPEGYGVEFRRVEFDAGAVRDAARKAHLPHLEWWLKWWAV